jgi:hypothetical protein
VDRPQIGILNGRDIEQCPYVEASQVRRSRFDPRNLSLKRLLLALVPPTAKGKSVPVRVPVGPG